MPPAQGVQTRRVSAVYANCGCSVCESHDAPVLKYWASVCRVERLFVAKDKIGEISFSSAAAAYALCSSPARAQ